MSGFVDIIIPIYNAYEDLAVCIDSLKRNTDLKKNRVVLIDDNSSDERIRPYLASLKKEGFHVIYNEENHGFSYNVNLGIAQSEENDVVLLNADTILTLGWLDKLCACAYNDAAIATTTPLSNNAALCSAPRFCEENELPDGYSLEEFANLIESCSLRRYPRITVAVGFCMFIKREVLRQIGGFDAETFGRDYGEENDFCFRAEQAGYYQAMCDDAYVYHSGTKSFLSDEKKKYIKAHEAILNSRYPVQMKKNDEHVQRNPNHFVQQNLGIYIPFHNGKKNILYLVQSDFREDASDHVGGVQLHVKDLTMELRRDFNIFVLARDGEALNCTGYTDTEEVRLRFYVGEIPSYPVFCDRKLREIYENILCAFSIDLIHVHHVRGLSLELYGAAEKYGIPVITSIHDYYFVCPLEKLLDFTGKSCFGEQERERCVACLKNKMQVTEKLDYLKIWRENSRRVLEQSARIIVPSVSAGEVIQKYFPETSVKTEVIEHGSDLPLEKIERTADNSSKAFRVAFVGGINEAKGAWSFMSWRKAPRWT